MNRANSRFWVGALCGGLAILAVGCVVNVDDDDGAPVRRPDASVLPPGPGDFRITWRLLTGDESVTLDNCPSDGTDIRVVVDPDPDTVGDEVYELFECKLGTGITGIYDAGVYDLQVQLGVFDESGTVVSLRAQSDLEQEVTLAPGRRLDVGFVFSVDRAQMTLEWTVARNGDASDCGALGAEDVAVLSTPISDAGTLYDATLACAAGAGITDPMPLGVYTVAVQLVDSLGIGLAGHDPVTFLDVSLDYGNEHEPLGAVELQVTQ